MRNKGVPAPIFCVGVAHHVTTTAALEKILASGEISKMSRHAVHLQADAWKAWQSAVRWKGRTPVVLKIDASALAENGVEFGRTENGVWCCHDPIAEARGLQSGKLCVFS